MGSILEAGLPDDALQRARLQTVAALSIANSPQNPIRWAFSAIFGSAVKRTLT